MKRIITIILIIVALTGLYFLWMKPAPKMLAPEVFPPETVPQKTTMKILSLAFTPNGHIPKEYTCDGNGFNPPLLIEGVPEAAKSVALIVDDPDAPNGLWVHWLLWNINPKTTAIRENEVPDGSVEGTTSFDKPGYGGPCPPSGTHRYFFKLYALDTFLNLSPSAKKSDLESTMEGHILDRAELVGLYSHGK